MTQLRVATAAALLLATAANSKPAAQPAPPPADRQAYSSAATAILVDVVVRDRKGRPVTDLSAGDFEIAEDGVPQRVDSFTRVSRGGGIGVGVAWRTPNTTVAVAPTGDVSAPAGGDATPEEATTALVFDHLSPEALGLAQRATRAYIPMSGESSVRIGVFAAGPGVRVVQDYTTDRALVRQALADVAPAGTSSADQKGNRTDDLIARRRALQEATDSAAAASAGAGTVLARAASQPGQRETELRLVQTELNMIRSFDTLDRDNRGYDTSLALLAVVRSLAHYPGRKTVVFFSEGLPASPALSARLDSVIDAANRANVTAYAIDAHGLRAKSTTDAMRKEIDVFAEERMVQNASGLNHTEVPLTMAFERVEDTLRLDSRTGLARLARDTGGFLVEGSNDLAAAFRRIDEDARFHYLLTYSPSATTFDGKFRTISVKVRRPGVQVFARKGYRAFPRAGAPDSGGYETPALALLDRTPLPNAFPVHAAGFSFPDPARPGLTPVLVQVRTEALRFTVDPQRSTYTAQTAIVVRIRDERGREVEKLSQEYLVAGDAKNVDAARNGDILFYREIDLRPGVYTMESIVFDAIAAQGSARVATLTVPAALPSRLGMSSLLLVNRVEEMGGDSGKPSGAKGPLYVGTTLLYPNLGAAVRRSGATGLPFYFALYGDVKDVRASAQLLRNGQALAEAPVGLPPSAGSRVQHVGRLPVGDLPAGTYELRIRVTDGRDEHSRTAFFTLVD